MKMTKFKIGDRVRRISSAHGGMTRGDVGEVTYISPAGGYIRIKGFDPDPEILHDPRYFEFVSQFGPVRTETIERKVIVPGIYGKVNVTGTYQFDRVTLDFVTDNFHDCPPITGMTATELREAAATFIALAEAVESNK